MRKRSHEEIQSQKPSVDEVKNKNRSPIYVVLDNIRSLYNVGAIFRTADAILVEKIYLCGITGAPPRSQISKTALGAEEIVPWEYQENSIEVVRELKSKGVKIVAVELAHDSVPLHQMQLDFPVCFIFGHEVEGISEDLMAEVDMSIELPMLGRANSLNVSVCFGIVMYEALKQLKS
jgi:tRNA G18 (ribose-2'-O)-methylase SpoU